MKKNRIPLAMLAVLMAQTVSAATIVDLQNQPVSYLQRFQLKRTRVDVDFKHTAHIRLQEMYAGMPVWDATMVVHVPQTEIRNKQHPLMGLSGHMRMNGRIYEGLEKDLSMVQSFALSDKQKTKALALAKYEYEQQNKLSTIKYREESVKKIIFVDANNHAHYAYLVSLYVDDGKTGAHRPTMIIDAENLHIYRHWDQVMTETVRA